MKHAIRIAGVLLALSTPCAAQEILTELERRNPWRDSTSSGWRIEFRADRELARWTMGSSIRDEPVKVRGNAVSIRDRTYDFDARFEVLLDRECVGRRLLRDLPHFAIDFTGFLSEDPLERRESLWWLVESHDPFDVLLTEWGSEGIQRCLGDSDPEVQAYAAYFMGNFGANLTRVRLFELLASPHPGVRREAVEALGAIGNPEDLPGVERLLDDEDPAVGQHARCAAWALRGKAR